MKKKDYKNPDVIQQIWIAVYAAEYVADFRKMVEVTNSFDKGLDHASAEVAETVADRAIFEWIRWNAEGR